MIRTLPGGKVWVSLTGNSVGHTVSNGLFLIEVMCFNGIYHLTVGNKQFVSRAETLWEAQKEALQKAAEMAQEAATELKSLIREEGR